MFSLPTGGKYQEIIIINKTVVLVASNWSSALRVSYFRKNIYFDVGDVKLRCTIVKYIA